MENSQGATEDMFYLGHFLLASKLSQWQAVCLFNFYCLLLTPSFSQRCKSEKSKESLTACLVMDTEISVCRYRNPLLVGQTVPRPHHEINRATAQ